MPSKKELHQTVSRLERKLIMKDREDDFRNREFKEKIEKLTEEVFPQNGILTMTRAFFGPRKRTRFDLVEERFDKQFNELREKLNILADHLEVYFTEEDANYAVVKKEKK